MIGVPEGEKKENGTEKVFEKMLAKCFPNLIKNIKHYVKMSVS